MTRRVVSAIAVAAAAALAACAVVGQRPPTITDPSLGEPTPVDSSRWVKPPRGYLADGGAPDAMKILPPPPAQGSAQHQVELAMFGETRALEGTPRWTQATRDADLSGKEAFYAFSCAAGVRINPEQTPTLSRMMLRIVDDAPRLYNPAKDFYNRPRPAAGNTAPICVPREAWIESNGSYPSGHSMIGYSWALLIAELAPDRATEVLTRGREFGDSRVICGLHWQSDVEAGRTLAGALMARLHADQAFQADLARAKREIAAARRLGAPTNCPAG